jgi:hypothetical protein
MLTFLVCDARIYSGFLFPTSGPAPFLFLVVGISAVSFLAFGHGARESASTKASALIACQMGYMLGRSTREPRFSVNSVDP